MNFSRWQYVKETKTGREYMTIRGQRYYFGDGIDMFHKYQRGGLFHGQTWCGHYLVQFKDKDCDQVRWVETE